MKELIKEFQINRQRKRSQRLILNEYNDTRETHHIYSFQWLPKRINDKSIKRGSTQGPKRGIRIWGRNQRRLNEPATTSNLVSISTTKDYWTMSSSWIPISKWNIKKGRRWRSWDNSLLDAKQKSDSDSYYSKLTFGEARSQIYQRFEWIEREGAEAEEGHDEKCIIYKIRIDVNERNIQVCEGVLGCGNSNLGRSLLPFLKIINKEPLISSLFSKLDVCLVLRAHIVHK